MFDGIRKWWRAVNPTIDPIVWPCHCGGTLFEMVTIVELHKKTEDDDGLSRPILLSMHAQYNDNETRHCLLSLAHFRCLKCGQYFNRYGETCQAEQT